VGFLCLNQSQIHKPVELYTYFLYQLLSFLPIKSALILSSHIFKFIIQLKMFTFGTLLFYILKSFIIDNNNFLIKLINNMLDKGIIWNI